MDIIGKIIKAAIATSDSFDLAMDEIIKKSTHPELLELSAIQTETTVKIIRLADKYGVDRNKLLINAVRSFTNVILGNDYSEFEIPGEDDKEETK